MTSSENAGYGLVSRLNHWIIAGGIIVMLGLGVALDKLDLDREVMLGMMNTHKSLGVLVLIFGLWRVSWRLVNGFPKAAARMPSWQEYSAKAVHIALLAAIIIMPISGLLMTVYGGHEVSVFGLFTIPAQEKVEAISAAGHVIHGTLAKLLIALILVHFAAALKHHFIDCDTTLTRMFGRSKSSRSIA